MYHFCDLVHYKGDDPIHIIYKDGFSRHRIIAVVTIVLVLSVFLTRLPQTNAQFVIAAWEGFPDELGQGIYGVTFWENSTGSFINILNPDTGISLWYPENTTTAELNYTANTALRVAPRVLLNYTNLGLAHPSDFDLGRNFVRVGVELFAAGTSLFSQQNLTYDDLGGLYETGLWWYVYVGIVNVTLGPGTIYTVRFIYEVFY